MKKEICAAMCVGIMFSGNIQAVERPVYAAEGNELGKTGTFPLIISSNRPDALGKCGESVVFSIIPAEVPAGAAKIRIFQWRNGLQTAVSDHEIKNFTISASSSEAAHLMITGVYIDRDGNEISPPPLTKGYGDGVFISPEKLNRARPRPEDFDSFWDDELKKLARIPMQVSRNTIRETAKWRCDDVSVSCTDGIPVTGFLIMPSDATPGSLPAVLYFQGAGFKSSRMNSEFKESAIVFDVNAHGIKNGMAPDFYRELNLNPPADRDIFSFRSDREKSYFKNMFLRVARALEFIKSLPEWDGKTLIVSGRSQGGAQAIAGAALDKDVSLCIANVPALADHGGMEAARKPGWPEINPRNQQEIAQASDYIDIINLANRIRCETLMSIGMIDAICPPASIWLAYQELKSKKSITLFPQLGHNAPPVKEDGRARIKKEILQ